MESYVKDVSGDVHEPETIREIVGRNKAAELMRRSDAWGLLFLFGHFGTMAVTGYFLYLSLGTWWVVPATVLHGFIIACLFAPYHECGHNSPFKTRRLNNVVYLVTGLLILQLPLKFRFEHADHHTYTQEDGRDPQILTIGEKIGGWLYYASAIPHFQVHFSNLIRTPFGRLSEFEKQSTPEAARPALQRQAWLFWAVYGAVAAISIWLQSWAVVIYWLMPRMVGDPTHHPHGRALAPELGCRHLLVDATDGWRDAPTHHPHGRACRLRPQRQCFREYADGPYVGADSLAVLEHALPRGTSRDPDGAFPQVARTPQDIARARKRDWQRILGDGDPANSQRDQKQGGEADAGTLIGFRVEWQQISLRGFVRLTPIRLKLYFWAVCNVWGQV